VSDAVSGRVEEFKDTDLAQTELPPAKSLLLEKSPSLRGHFPFAEARPSQNAAMKALEKWNGSPKKFFIYEGPTGSGKSGIDIAEASYAKTMPGYQRFQQGAYILTPMKSLAEQYMTDFEPMGLVELKGRNNFPCDKWTGITGEPVDCETGAILNKSTGLDNERCAFCPYRAAKERFIAAPFGTTNFSYYLNETSHSGQLPDRNVLILDEGHNTEEQILRLTETVIDKKLCKEYGVADLPVFDEGDNAAVLVWLDSVFMPAANAHANKLAKKFKEARDEERAKIAKKISGLERFLQRLNRFRNSNDPGEWLCWSDWAADARSGKAYGTGDLLIKPLTARLFADELLFSKAQKVLITSATILDFETFMRNLGIRPSDATTLATPSEFPVENRPMFYSPVGNMRQKDIDTTLPKMAPAIEQLLTRYFKHKGICHTHSYKINRFVTQYLQSTPQASRVVTHDSTKGSRDRALDRHFSSKEPTVLFSPSMSEGLDLTDDLSRFQIITKVPFPPLTPYIKARMRRDPDWYQWQTSLHLVQGTGRSNRHKDDRAHTHILDAGFADFITQNNRRLPDYWLNAIVW